jgi:hypothetical protein
MTIDEKFRKEEINQSIDNLIFSCIDGTSYIPFMDEPKIKYAIQKGIISQKEVNDYLISYKSRISQIIHEPTKTQNERIKYIIFIQK